MPIIQRNRSTISKVVNIDYGNNTFSVLISFENRKRLSITVHPDLKITAKAPSESTIEEVRKYIRKRASWISRQLHYFEKFQPITPERQYVSGETHYYLGRQYRLRIREGYKPHVKLIGRFFEMELRDKDNRFKARDIMFEWYRNHAKIFFSRHIDHYTEHVKKFGTQRPELKIRRMKKRWGSCSDGKSILINTELIKAPIYCIDYVIVHELCHLLYPNHNAEFYTLLRRILPAWEKYKERLEKATF